MKKEDVQGKKLNNKGFSLVEIIIVIAIMAILAGALAPQLIKYIDKSRKSADIQTAQTIATAVNAALADEAGYLAAGSTKLSSCISTGNAFQSKIAEIIGRTGVVPKTKTFDDFYIKVDTSANTVAIYGLKSGDASTDDANYQLYPAVGSSFK